MTHSTEFEATTPRALGSGLSVLRAKSGWIIAFGAFVVVLGILAFSSMVTATEITVEIVGILMICAGLVEIFMGVQAKSWSRFFLWIMLGLAYTFAGLFTATNTLMAAGFLTLMLGFALLASGLVRIFLAFQMRAGSGWLWVVFSGMITTALGCLILTQWPFSSLYVLGMFLSIDLLLAGWGWISLGIALRRLHHRR